MTNAAMTKLDPLSLLAPEKMPAILYLPWIKATYFDHDKSFGDDIYHSFVGSHCHGLYNI